MKVISEPKYQDFNGNIYTNEKDCINAEKDFVKEAFKMLNKIAIGCRRHGNYCRRGCPFYNSIAQNCAIEHETGRIPDEWNRHLEEEE